MNQKPYRPSVYVIIVEVVLAVAVLTCAAAAIIAGATETGAFLGNLAFAFALAGLSIAPIAVALALFVDDWPEEQ